MTNSEQTRQAPTDQSVHSGPVDLGAGITREWLADGRILFYSATVPTQEAVDKWINDLTDMILNWPVEQPCYLLYDFSDERIRFTSYIARHIQPLANLRPELLKFIAITLPRNVVGSAIMLIINNLIWPSTSHYKVIFNYQEGLDWLCGLLDQACKPGDST